MDIALFNVEILFQKSTVTTDAIGNHTNHWEDYYPCHATVSGESGAEQAIVGTTVVNTEVSFTLRFCSAVSAIDTDHYRICFRDEIYNIIAIDHMSYKKKSLKFKCKKVRR